MRAALIFAPIGALVPAALRATAPGGTVVCAGIHMDEAEAALTRLRAGSIEGSAVITV